MGSRRDMQNLEAQHLEVQHLEVQHLEVQSGERSLNLDAIRASLEDAAAVLAEMSGVDASEAQQPINAFGNRARVESAG